MQEKTKKAKREQYLRLKKFNFENKKALLEAVSRRKKYLNEQKQARKKEDDWLIANKIGPLEAKENNCTRYFSIKPCTNGHVGLRFVANQRCLICNSRTSAEQKKRQARIFKERLAGFEEITIRIHPLDKEKVLKWVNALSAARLF